jgi:hypothetical protein
MAQYFLSCTCGQKVRVETAQAGGQVACACGRSLTVPTLRGLRALEEAPLDAVARQRAAGRRWSPLQGGLFSVGLLVMVISLGVLAFNAWQYLQATDHTRDPSSDINEIDSQVIDTIPPADALDEFYRLRSEGLGQPAVMPWVQWQNFAAERRTLMIVAGIAAALGLLAIVVSLIMRPATGPA